MFHASKISFTMMSLVHETLYGMFRNPRPALIAAGVKPGQRVLEVGCGPGFFTLGAARIVGADGRVVALDLNPYAVRHVQAKAAREQVQNVELMVADAAHTQLADQSFDLVLLFGFARPVGTMAKIWQELHRLLLPGGILAIEGRQRPPSELFERQGRQGRVVQYTKKA